MAEYDRSVGFMNRWLNVTISLAALAIVGCNQADDADPLDDVVSSGEESAEITWVEIAPGVWERPRLEGGFERLGFGLQAFEFALERARQERVALLDLRDRDAPDLETRLHKNLELINYLRSTVDEAGEVGEPEPLTPPSVEATSLAASSPSSSSAVSDYVCAGSYNFDIQFYYGMVDGAVATTASWNEFGPYAPYQKTLHTYSYAWAPDYSPSDHTDSDYYGPFSHSCCASVSSYAGVGVTFRPMLYGSAYVSVTSGCSAFRFYEASNYSNY
jgi:hypothetical protein